MIPKDKARARNDLNTAAKKLAAFFVDLGHAKAAGDLLLAAEKALKVFDALKKQANGGDE